MLLVLVVVLMLRRWWQLRRGRPLLALVPCCRALVALGGHLAVCALFRRPADMPVVAAICPVESLLHLLRCGAAAALLLSEVLVLVLPELLRPALLVLLRLCIDIHSITVLRLHAVTAR